MDMIQPFVNAASAVFGLLADLPAWASAILVGWAISVAMVQPGKFLLPADWDTSHRELLARLGAFVTAAVPAYLYATSRDLVAAQAVLVAIGAGAWSPMAYVGFSALLRRVWPAGADLFSGDHRGVAASFIANLFRKQP